MRRPSFFFYLKGVSFERNDLPHERDAIRISKKINYSICGQKEVDDFISGNIEMKNIDVTYPYDIEKETYLLWDKYLDEIESTVALSKEFLENYEYYLSSKVNDNAS